MTREERNDAGGDKQDATGDITPDGTALSDQEAAELGGEPGRGARPVPGAVPSDEDIDEHVEVMGEQGPKLPDRGA
jgi:hypothetical protein